MKKTPKNIPTYYNFPGTPIFRDTTALPFGLGGPTNNPVLPTVPARTIDTNINPTIEPFVVPSFSNFDKYAGKHYHYNAGTNEYRTTLGDRLNNAKDTIFKPNQPVLLGTEKGSYSFAAGGYAATKNNVIDDDKVKGKKIKINDERVPAGLTREATDAEIAAWYAYSSKRNPAFTKDQPYPLQLFVGADWAPDASMGTYYPYGTGTLPGITSGGSNIAGLPWGNSATNALGQPNNGSPKGNSGFPTQIPTQPSSVTAAPGNIKPPASETEWIQNPATGTWFQKETPVAPVNLQEYNLQSGSYAPLPTSNIRYADGGPLNDKTNHGKLLNSVYASALGDYYANGGMLKRADGSYSPRGLWDNIRDNAGSGKKPTKQMLAQEKKINKEYKEGGKLKKEKNTNTEFGNIDIAPEGTREYQIANQPKANNYEQQFIDKAIGAAKLFYQDLGIYDPDDFLWSKMQTAVNPTEVFKLAKYNVYNDAYGKDRRDQVDIFGARYYPGGQIGTKLMGYFDAAIPTDLYPHEQGSKGYGDDIVNKRINEPVRSEFKQVAMPKLEQLPLVKVEQNFPEPTPIFNRTFRTGGQFPRPYSLPEDSFKQGGRNLHNSIYASSAAQYPAVYNFGGTLKNNLATRQQMYMPLDHITRTGGSILSMSNTPQLEGEGKDLVYAGGGNLPPNGEQPIINKAQDEAETYAYAKAADKERWKELMDNTRALMDTAQGRKLWYQDLKPKNFSIEELQRFTQGVKEYNQGAQDYERARRKAQEDKISGDDFARMYKEKGWAKYDQATMKEGYQGQFQDAADEAQKRKEANMVVTDTALELITGAPALFRVAQDPWGTVKGIGNTIADAALSANPGIGAIFGAGDPNINPLTGNQYWSGLDKTLDVAGIIPGIGSLGKLGKAGLKGADKFSDLKKVNKLNQEEKVFGTYGHDIETNPNIVYKESKSGDIIPFNNATGKSLQEEYVSNMKEYYDSPEFKRIMKEEYPDVDINQYKKVTLENLENELTYNPSEVPEEYAGAYTLKNSNLSINTPWNRPSFRQKVNNANTNKFQILGRGKSHISDPSATWHELSHQRTNANELLPDQLTRSHLEENADPFAEGLEYHAMPTEFDVRLRQLKEDLKTQGINDYFTNPVTEEHIKQLDAYRLKEEGDALFKQMKSKYRDLKNSGAPKEDLEAVKSQYFDSINVLENKIDKTITSTDTQDLLSRWNPGFLAEKARTIPALVPITGAVGGAALLSNPWQQEQKTDLAYGKGGELYTYSGRPDAQYQKTANGWAIKTPYNDEFTLIKDPTGKRTALLNEQATIIKNK